MIIHDLDLPIDPELERRLRRTLAAVAETVTDGSRPALTPLASVPTSMISPTGVEGPSTNSGAKWKKRRRPAIVLASAALALVAAGYGLNSTYVDQIPPQNAFITGTAMHDRYWLVPSFHADACGRPFDGVELVMESENKVGQEWLTAATAYGETRTIGELVSGCVAVDESAWLSHPSRAGTLFQRLGEGHGSWVTVLALHPSVTAVRITDPGRPARTLPTTPMPARPNGPRYVVFTTDAAPTKGAVQWTLLTANGKPVPADEPRPTSKP